MARADRTASTGLANSARKPSPVVFTRRSSSGWITAKRKALMRAAVPSSSRSIMAEKPSRESKAGKCRQLAGERLGGSHADFGACECRQYDLARARYCRAWHVDNRKDALPMSFGEFQRGAHVGGLSGLRYKQGSPDCRNR